MKISFDVKSYLPQVSLPSFSDVNKRCSEFSQAFFSNIKSLWTSITLSSLLGRVFAKPELTSDGIKDAVYKLPKDKKTEFFYKVWKNNGSPCVEDPSFGENFFNQDPMDSRCVAAYKTIVKQG